ncbi:MAG TPA: hypothetical protein VGK19_22090 [Capsulimonadaceae bacterium]
MKKENIMLDRSIELAETDNTKRLTVTHLLAINKGAFCECNLTLQTFRTAKGALLQLSNIKAFAADCDKRGVGVLAAVTLSGDKIELLRAHKVLLLKHNPGAEVLFAAICFAKLAGKGIQTSTLDLPDVMAKEDGTLDVSDARELDRLQTVALERMIGMHFWTRSHDDSLLSTAHLADKYRSKYASGPIGIWRPTNCTELVLFDEVWEFRADGTGTVASYGVFHQPESTTEFEWRSVADLTIECRELSRQYAYTLEGEVSEEDGDVDDDEWEDPLDKNWVSITYDFVPLDESHGVEMAQVVDGSVTQSFWTSDDRLSLQ